MRLLSLSVSFIGVHFNNFIEFSYSILTKEISLVTNEISLVTNEISLVIADVY